MQNKDTEIPMFEVKLKKQMTVNINGTTYRINHIYTGSKTIGEMYENLIERKLNNT